MNHIFGPFRQKKLVAAKLLHTVVWAFMVACILSLPMFGAMGHFRLAALAAGIVLLECLALVSNGRRCPLSACAALYMAGRKVNFDIYLPCWLAENNPNIFGNLFLINLIALAVAWCAPA